MNTSIIKKDFWRSDEYIELHLDTKIVYLYLLAGPDKGYLNVFKFNKQLASLSTGVSKHSLEAGLEQLEKIGYIETYEGYVGLLKGHASPVGGQYGGENKARELASLPVDIREHFNLDEEGITVVERSKKVAKKPGPAPETINSIISKQPQVLQSALTDLVADRIERKKAPTTRAVKGWINKLEQMYPNQPNRQVESIQQSIDRGWMGLFEVKVEQNSGGGAFM